MARGGGSTTVDPSVRDRKAPRSVSYHRASYHYFTSHCPGDGGTYRHLNKVA